MALAAQDPSAAAKSAGVEVSAPPSEGFKGALQVALARDATCGVRTRMTEPLDIAAGRSELIERVDHLGVASQSNARARQVFIDGLGCVYESQQTDSEVETFSENFTSDTYDLVFHTRPPRLVGSMRVTFITVGDCEFEFLQT